MRRVLLFAAFLLLLGLTTATAASFDVQAEDITSFSQTVDIEVPPVYALPPEDGYFLTGTFTVGQESLGLMETGDVPTDQNSVVTGKFQPLATHTPPLSLDTASGAADNGNRVWYMAWTTGAPHTGVSFRGHRLGVVVDRGNNFVGTITAGLYRCAAGAPAATVTTSDCHRLARWTGSGVDPIVSGPISADVPPNEELRLKLANETASEWTIQWGYKLNRPSALEVIAP